LLNSPSSNPLHDNIRRIDVTATVDTFKKIFMDLKIQDNIEAYAIVSRDGILISSDMSEGMITQTLAAMTATMLGAAEIVTAQLNKGVLSRIIVEFDYGKLICMGAGPKAILIATTESDAAFDMILVELEKSAAKLKEIM
jgi:predicted regulator of Ras-like GTPase activity (Roadblock/LC7/MglB family)